MRKRDLASDASFFDVKMEFDGFVDRVGDFAKHLDCGGEGIDVDF